MSIRKLKARGIGRLELLAWLNEFLETDYTKVPYARAHAHAYQSAV